MIFPITLRKIPSFSVCIHAIKQFRPRLRFIPPGRDLFTEHVRLLFQTLDNCITLRPRLLLFLLSLLFKRCLQLRALQPLLQFSRIILARLLARGLLLLLLLALLLRCSAGSSISFSLARDLSSSWAGLWSRSSTPGSSLGPFLSCLPRDIFWICLSAPVVPSEAFFVTNGVVTR